MHPKEIKLDKYAYTFQLKVEKFPGKGGWIYVSIPEAYTDELTNTRKAWGMYPIVAQVGKTQWSTKLMMKKGGHFFIALKAEIRKKEKIHLGDTVTVSFNILVM